MKKESDLDLLIVEKELFGRKKSRRNEIIKIREALSKFRLPKDILVYDKDEFDEREGSTNHIIAKSLKEGEILYER